MVPVVFRTPRSLAALNVIGVAMAIAAMTTAAFMMFEGRPDSWPLIVGLPSVFIAGLWAAMLRRRETLTGRRIPVAWLLSVPLAAANGGLACGLMLFHDSPRVTSLVGGFFLGATFGVIIWAPALVLVLLFFGLPIAHAQRLARQGLAGEERGERVVGLACAAVSLAAVAVSLVPSLPLTAALVLFYAFAWFGVLSGFAAMWIAHHREALRRRFVARVEAEEVPGMRIETRAEGKVLVRVEPHIDAYRLPPPTDEEIFELGLDGSAVRATRAGSS
jgi:hypothetical protein